MAKRWQRPPISRLEILEALGEAPGAASTWDVLKQARSSASRHQIYYGLAKLERDGYVSKEIIFGATSIGHAHWDFTEKGLAALRAGEELP